MRTVEGVLATGCCMIGDLIGWCVGQVSHRHHRCRHTPSPPLQLPVCRPLHAKSCHLGPGAVPGRALCSTCDHAHARLQHYIEAETIWLIYIGVEFYRIPMKLWA